MRERHRYLLKRAGLTLLSLFTVATLLFFAFRLLPGDPTTAVIAPQMSAEARAELAAQYGLNRPLHVQYVLYLESLLTWDLGLSFRYNEPVTEIIAGRLLNTLVLMVTAVVLAYAIGILVGAFLAWKRNSRVDVYGTGAVLVMYAAPVFWTGMVGLMVFSFQLGWLPSSGMHSVTFVADSVWERYLSVDFLRHLILPLTVTVLYFLSVPALTMRNNMIDVLDADFIELAQAAGLSEFAVLYRHAARNALLPVLHYAAVSLGFAFGGSVIIETVFSWPGIGRMMWQATLSQDYPLAQNAFLMLATIVIVMNFLADVLSVYVDPRAAVTE
jgi:peptide/nickel transport system permease protein